MSSEEDWRQAWGDHAKPHIPPASMTFRISVHKEFHDSVYTRAVTQQYGEFNTENSRQFLTQALTNFYEKHKTKTRRATPETRQKIRTLIPGPAPSEPAKYLTSTLQGHARKDALSSLLYTRYDTSKTGQSDAFREALYDHISSQLNPQGDA